VNGAEKSGVLLCVGGKTRGAVRVCLDFWAPPFASRQKVETHHLKRITKRRTPLTPMLRQPQHDKAQEAGTFTISLKMQE
jgi:hypothetical protein